MGKRKKKAKHEEHVDESWLIPYADLLTLLLALFIVLFASSSVDAKKFEAVSDAFNSIFTSGTGVLEQSSIVVEDDAGSQTQSTDQETDANADTTLPEEEATELTAEEQEIQDFLNEQSARDEAIAQDQAELREIQEILNAYIAENGLSDQFATELLDEGLLLTIRDSILFQSGSADVQASYREVAGEVSDLLEFDPPRNVIITGHTDNVPIGNAAFSSNWELSVMRAVNFMKLVIENPELDPRWFSAKGFGEFQPIASNDTEEGRAANRRVEVLILPRVTADSGTDSVTSSPE